MAFWDFFRKKKEEIVETEKISQDELQKWLAKKEQETEKQKQEFLHSIKNKINELVSELKEEILVLKEVDVDEKKAEDKIKLIVKENLENFIDYSEKLVARLKEVNEEIKMVENINLIFEDFDKRSRMSYEKATFLIGKEMGNVKESIRNFFRELQKTSVENKRLIEKIKTIESIKKKIGKQKEILKIKSELLENIQEIEKKVKIKEEEITSIKSSREFAEQEKKKNELENKKQELEKEINQLRGMINFKQLASFYHKFEKEMGMIREHKDNFKQAFEKTNGEDLKNLLEESKLQDVNILSKINAILEKKQEICALLEVKSDVTDSLKKISSDIETLNLKQSAEKKKAEKLENNLNEIASLIKDELKRINVELWGK